MKQYSKEYLNNFRTNINRCLNTIEASVNWCSTNLKFDAKEHALDQLKSSRRTLNRISRVMESKPVIAVFGASQVGKSYLIKNLLSISGKPLMIHNNGQEYDFLKKINPPGTGAESTGVVTRFSIEKQSPYEDFPIKAELLTVKDFAIILCDSFSLDCKKITEFPSKEEFESIINEIEKKYGASPKCQDVLSEDDILDIRDYFNEHLSRNAILFERISSTKYWERLGNLISKIPAAEWVNALSILWNNTPDISNIFKKLVSSLESIEFNRIVYLPFQAVLRDGGAILDVRNLKKLLETNNQTIITAEKGGKYSIDISIISALISELVLSVPSELIQEKIFLENSDLLDFPGARSRLALEQNEIKNEIIPDMILRGKVAYLFNKYTNGYNINTLLFCANDKQLDVNEIPDLLYSWIRKNIGTTADEREGTLAGSMGDNLFVIFTFFNNQLRFDTTNDTDHSKLDYKWTNRFIRFFENEIATSTKKWHKEWRKSSMKFKNFYLLRDFKYSDDIFSGFENTGAEEGIRTERSEYLKALRSSFLEFPFVQDHFTDPEHAWDIASLPNKDGTEHIIKNLVPVSTNLAKTKYNLIMMNNELTKMIKVLETHAHSSDLGEMREKSLNAYMEIYQGLNQMIEQDPLNYTHLTNALSIKPVEVFAHLHNVIMSENEPAKLTKEAMLKKECPDLSPQNSHKRNLEILQAHWNRATIEDTEDFLKTNGYSMEKLFESKKNNSKAQQIVDSTIQVWTSKLSENETLMKIGKLGLKPTAIDNLLKHYLEVIKLRSLDQKLYPKYREKISDYKNNRGTEEFLSEFSASIFNDIVVNFGLKNLSEEEKEELKKLADKYNIKSNQLEKSQSNHETISESDLKTLFDHCSTNVSEEDVLTSFSGLLKNYNQWINNLKLSMIGSCGFITYDENANKTLLNLVSELKNIETEQV